MGEKEKIHSKGRSRLNLPFKEKKSDAGSWAYDHKTGILAMVCVYLILGILFVGSKIVMGRTAHTESIIIDMQNMEMLEKERERLLEEVRKKNSQVDWSAVRNVSSNENALNEKLEDAKGTNVHALNEEARRVEEMMQQNRASYESELHGVNASMEAQRKAQTDDKKNSQNKKSDRKLKGMVTVSFSISNPTRYSRFLYKPAYRCEGGGEVVVDVVVDRGGNVLQAKAQSGGNECMREAATSSALISKFDINQSAPERQFGTITYIFIPQ